MKMERRAHVVTTAWVLGLACVISSAAVYGQGQRQRALPSSARATPTPPPAGVVELAKGNNQFAVDLYAQLKSGKGNLFLSPYSIRTALAMPYAGAQGETAGQMEQALNLTLKGQALHEAFRATMADLVPAEKSGYQLTIANSLWGQTGYKFLAPFLDVNGTCYGGGFKEADFAKAPEPARGAINMWVEEKTKEKIKDVIPPGGIDPLTRLVLVNAIWFKGDWLDKFKKEMTTDQPFAVSATEKVTAPLMHRTGKYRYAEAEDLQMLELPYAGERLCMVVLLPKSEAGISKIEGLISADNLNQWLANLDKQWPREVDAYFPRFKMTWDTSKLNGPLQALGMKDPFVFGKADFSGINGIKPPADEAFFIAAVFHKAFVDVNEEGTEAAAATGVTMETLGMPEPPPVFRADHPFVFMIRDKASGNILFLGRLMNPKA